MTNPAKCGAAPAPPSRRKVLGAAAGATFLASACAREAPARSIGFASTGGPFNDVLRRVWTDAFERRTGVKVNLSASTSLTQTRLQCATDRPQWDVVELTGPWYVLAMREGLLLPLDTDIVKTSALPSGFVGAYGVQYSLYNNCIAWDRRAVSDRLAPRGWADVWDLKTRPGKRSLDTVNGGAGTLEMALMADGQKPEALYPLDLDRAFRSLDRLGARNILWSQSIEQPIERLVSQEVSMASSWPYRVTKANAGGADLGMNFSQCTLDGDWVGVVKTSRDPKAAFELINALIADPHACAEFSRLTHYGTPNLQSLKLMPEADADLTPTNPKLSETLLRPDDAWWADHLVQVSDRFKQWQLGVSA